MRGVGGRLDGGELADKHLEAWRGAGSVFLFLLSLQQRGKTIRSQVKGLAIPNDFLSDLAWGGFGTLIE